MEENTNRNVFGLHGVTGMLIATVLLLSILAFLTVKGISAQRAVANKPYTINNISNIKTEGKNSAKFKVIEK